jgi:hypothetical protein
VVAKKADSNELLFVCFPRWSLFAAFTRRPKVNKRAASANNFILPELPGLEFKGSRNKSPLAPAFCHLSLTCACGEWREEIWKFHTQRADGY